MPLEFLTSTEINGGPSHERLVTALLDPHHCEHCEHDVVIFNVPCGDYTHWTLGGTTKACKNSHEIPVRITSLSRMGCKEREYGFTGHLTTHLTLHNKMSILKGARVSGKFCTHSRRGHMALQSERVLENLEIEKIVAERIAYHFNSWEGGLIAGYPNDDQRKLAKSCIRALRVAQFIE